MLTNTEFVSYLLFVHLVEFSIGQVTKTSKSCKS